MFDVLTRSDLSLLASARGERLVSVYLPTRKAGRDTRENPIRLKNLLRKAEEELVATGMRRTEARDMVRPGYELEEVQEWRPELGEGLALFFDESGLRRFRLPVEVPELVVVSDRFDVKPLLPMFTEAGVYFLLALSMNEARLFQGRRFGIEEVAVEAMPRGMADALWPDDPSKQHQFHTLMTGISGRGRALRHSSGDESLDRLKEDIGRYFKMVDNALTKAVEDESTPLVIAGVDYLHPIFKDVSNYRTILDEGVEGNPDQARAEDLAQEAWPIVERFYERKRAADAERFGNLTGTGKASTDLVEILGAVRQGRVETLWVTAGEQRWGRIEDDGRVVTHETKEPGDEDLFDLAAVETLANSGKVFAVEPGQAPGGGPVAAIFRY